ncbi:hypothetical protein KUW18_08420 [Halomonas sp. DP5Y7-2]|uniref:hypothetical protein n=1 Tax=Halomonas sp. DP5Y7-2 TaxID=2859076 RepID=UPI001C9A1A29|nr:hypothetical protein [Halomonas sp. DP5Y7-2]MBY5984113.1 hypothetical protein [Halomonas sp. DP5Y7-2]
MSLQARAGSLTREVIFNLQGKLLPQRNRSESDIDVFNKDICHSRMGVGVVGKVTACCLVLSLKPTRPGVT